MLISRKWWKQPQNCVIYFINFNICNRMTQLRMLCSITLSIIFKVNKNFCYAFAINIVQWQWMFPADLPRNCTPPPLRRGAALFILRPCGAYGFRKISQYTIIFTYQRYPTSQEEIDRQCTRMLLTRDVSGRGRQVGQGQRNWNLAVSRAASARRPCCRRRGIKSVKSSQVRS